MNLLEQQALNRRRTWYVMVGFIAFLLFIGLGVDLFVLGLESATVPVGALLGVAVGSVSALVSYYTGDRAVLAASAATPLDETLAEAASEPERLKLRQLDNVVEEMAIASGQPKPKVYVVSDPDLNAFATGRDPAHASIAVTRGLLDRLSRDELQAVVAHEMSHVRNYDIRLMTLIAALLGAIALLSEFARRGMRRGGTRGGRRGRSGKGGSAAMLVFLIIWVIAILLAPLVGRMLAMAVSRRREYLADASGAELTRNPGALASALEKINAATEPTRAIKQGTAHLCIADPLARAIDQKEGRWADLLASHPPMARRIEALRQMAYLRAQ